VIHDGILYDPIQGQSQGHGGRKLVKLQIIFSGMHVTKANGEL